MSLCCQIDPDFDEAVIDQNRGQDDSRERQNGYLNIINIRFFAVIPPNN
jgi:hypothetical protein